MSNATAQQPQEIEKTCTRCEEAWPADTEFFRLQPKAGHPARLAPWCRACEADYQREKRSLEARGAGPLHIVQTTGAADFLGPLNGNRRWFFVQADKPAPLHEFRIKVPGHSPFAGLFPNARAAQLEAEQLFPEAPPASVVCTSRKRQEARA